MREVVAGLHRGGLVPEVVVEVSSQGERGVWPVRPRDDVPSQFRAQGDAVIHRDDQVAVPGFQIPGRRAHDEAVELRGRRWRHSLHQVAALFAVRQIAAEVRQVPGGHGGVDTEDLMVKAQ